MPRVTLDLDACLLTELKRRGQREGKSLGRVVSELLAESMNHDGLPASTPFVWKSSRMNSLVDLDDAEAVRLATGD